MSASTDSFCQAMGAKATALLGSNGVLAYDTPNALTNPQGSGIRSYADTHRDPQGNATIHVGMFQRRANGTVQRIADWEVMSLFNHELVHATFGYGEGTNDFNQMRQRCG